MLSPWDKPHIYTYILHTNKHCWNKISKQGRKCEMFDMNLGCPVPSNRLEFFFSTFHFRLYILYALADGFYYEADFSQRKQILSGGDFEQVANSQEMSSGREADSIRRVVITGGGLSHEVSSGKRQILSGGKFRQEAKE